MLDFVTEVACLKTHCALPKAHSKVNVKVVASTDVAEKFKSVVATTFDFKGGRPAKKSKTDFTDERRGEKLEKRNGWLMKRWPVFRQIRSLRGIDLRGSVRMR